jgi:transcriptional regulator with XRE-family HTH domain
MRTLGEQLKIARELRKLSLRDVELATGISNPYLSQLEHDKIRKPSPQFLGKLSSLYSLNYQVLMEAAGYLDPRPKESTRQTLAGELFRSQKISLQEEEKILDYLRFLRSSES